MYLCHTNLIISLVDLIQSLYFALVDDLIFIKVLDIASTMMVIVFIFAIAYGMWDISMKKDIRLPFMWQLAYVPPLY